MQAKLNWLIYVNLDLEEEDKNKEKNLTQHKVKGKEKNEKKRISKTMRKTLIEIIKSLFLSTCKAWWGCPVNSWPERAWRSAVRSFPS